MRRWLLKLLRGGGVHTTVQMVALVVVVEAALDVQQVVRAVVVGGVTQVVEIHVLAHVIPLVVAIVGVAALVGVPTNVLGVLEDVVIHVNMVVIAVHTNQ